MATSPPQRMQTNVTGTRTGWLMECTADSGGAADCGFILRNHDWPEFVELAIRHVRNSHATQLDEAAVRAGSKVVRY